MGVGGRRNAPSAEPLENEVCRHICSSNCHAFLRIVRACVLAIYVI